MFAAASGARLAHRHNKAVKKQISSSQIEGLQVHYRGYTKQEQLKNTDVHGNRFAGIAHRRPNYTSKLYCESNLKLSSSFIDINGRIAKLGRVDFEGKAAWQDREVNHELEARESICVPSEAAITHRTKQREAHRRWVKRNRIHDLSFGDCSSNEELLYGVQNGAANLLLYVGLGTMCVGMIIAFVGTGEKGFKTMELRLIGPSLIGAGVLIIILRIMLCVCPSKCLTKKHKHKLKNSTNKLNSEGNPIVQEVSCSSEKPEKSDEEKKRVSISMLPTTSGLSMNSSETSKPAKMSACEENPGSIPPVQTMSFLENEKPNKSKDTGNRKTCNLISSQRKIGEDGEGRAEGHEKTNFELKPLSGSDYDVTSLGTENSFRSSSNFPETLLSPDNSDISITSLVNASPPPLPDPPEGKKQTKPSKFEVIRTRKNIIPTEILLCPSNLNDSKDAE